MSAQDPLPNTAIMVTRFEYGNLETFGSEITDIIMGAVEGHGSSVLQTS